MPTRRLPAGPSIENLRNQAKRLLKACRAGAPDAQERLAEHPRWATIGSEGASLADAQLVVAREYGFEDWTALRGHVVRSQGTDPDIQPRLLSMAPEARAEWLMAALRRETAARLGIADEQVGPDTPLATLDASLENRWALSEFQTPMLCALLRTTYEPLPGPSLTTLRLLVDYLVREYEATKPPLAHEPLGDPYDRGRLARPLPTPRRDASRKNPRMVFILCSPRSGSTLLRVMLMGHPALFAPPELFLLPYESMGQKREQNTRQGHGWMNWGLGAALEELQGLSTDMKWEAVQRLEEGDVPIQGVYGLLQGLIGDDMLVDKTALYAMHPRWLLRAEEMFENPLYIDLCRHPYAAMESFVRMRLHRHLDHLGGSWGVRDDNLWRFAEKWWAVSHRHIDEFLRGIPETRKHRVRFEDLVTDPKAVMARVCAFLRIPFDEAVVMPYRGDRMADGLGDPNLPSRSRIDERLATVYRERRPPQRLSAFARNVARRAGYELP